MKAFKYYIDVVGGCNLRCPSCPSGNSVQRPHAHGIMNAKMFKLIVEKISSENGAGSHISLYNWGEPMLHPELGRLIGIANGYGFQPSISTNFNNAQHIEECAKGISSLRISLSGFFQETYEKAHVKGDIEQVKLNMRKLRDLLNRTQSRVHVHVDYHCYAYNLGDDYYQMRRFCKELGFMFFPFWPHLMPIEKALECCKGLAPKSDLLFADSFPIPLKDAVVTALRYCPRDCPARDMVIGINSDGSVPLCCGVYDSAFNIADNFLSTPHAMIQRRKTSHQFCRACMEYGLHVVSQEICFRQWNRIAAGRLGLRKLPKELVRYGVMCDLLHHAETVLGPSVMDQTVEFLNRIVFRFRKR